MGKRIIISRTDNIGDVILTLPMAGLLKQKFPDSHIIFLGKSYIYPIIKACKNIDEFADWGTFTSLSRKEAIEKFQSFQADIIIHVLSNKTIAQYANKAKIPIQIASKRKLYNLLYANKLLNFSRRKSNLHEAQLNSKLLAPLGFSVPASFDVIAKNYGMIKLSPLSASSKVLLVKNKLNIILHPKSRGSAKEWGLNNFNDLIEILDAEKYNIFITGTAEEGEAIKDKLPFTQSNIINLCGKLSLEELISFIAKCDGLIAASTGPLHIASAQGIATIGLFSMRRPIHPGRWAPIGRKSYFIVYDENCPKCAAGKNCDCITKITPKQVKKLLERIG